MPIKNKIIISSALSIVVAIGIIAFNHKKKSNRERPQRLTSMFSSKGVGDRIINLAMHADEVNTNEELAEVSVDISMPFSFDSSVYYKWKLGEGVTLIEGPQSGQLAGISHTQSLKLRIKVKGFSKQINHQVGFEIYGFKNGRKIYGDSIIASDKESTFEDIVQNVEKIKASQ
ncbi:hypothetical protein K2P97_00940 [bacterium]|nr:hypothetical protein [bacterium]